ncbi:MAG: DUF4102 domain-containing protein, partial [Geminicoccaceae bacterium]|nr:DUF4102 domain-containing protein [Geminicoccaceae bacterium]
NSRLFSFILSCGTIKRESYHRFHTRTAAERVTSVLTKRLADTAEPFLGEDGRSRETVLWDASVAGFGLRVSPVGAKAFILKYRAGRGRDATLRKVTIGRYGSPHTVETARREARRLLGIVAAGGDPAGDKAEKRRDQRSGKATRGSVARACQEWLRRATRPATAPPQR